MTNSVVPKDFFANVSQRMPGISCWEFTVPYRDGYFPVSGELIHTGKGWRWYHEGKFSKNLYPNRQHAAYSAWMKFRKAEVAEYSS